MSRLCQFEVRRSNEKSLLLPGLFANKLAQTLAKLAEGEELGSNLLHAIQSSRGGLGD